MKPDYEMLLKELLGHFNEELMWRYIEGTELGEVCELLCQLALSAHLSEEFELALEKELLEQYTWFKENTRIVTKTETRKITITELEFDV